MKKLKKILTILFTITVLTTITACNRQKTPDITPEKTVSIMFKNIKSNNKETIRKYTDLGYIINMHDELNSALDIKDKNLTAKLEKMLFDFDYTISDCEINKNEAVITISITTYPFRDVFKNISDEYLVRHFNKDDNDKESDEDYLIKQANKQLDSISKNYTEEGKITLKIKDDKWFLKSYTDLDRDFQQAISGGFEISNYINLATSKNGILDKILEK